MLVEALNSEVEIWQTTVCGKKIACEFREICQRQYPIGNRAPKHAKEDRIWTISYTDRSQLLSYKTAEKSTVELSYS
jgi:hypothetical protein